MSDARLYIGGAPVTRPLVRLNLNKGFGKHSLCVVDIAYGRSLAQGVSDVLAVPEWTSTVLDLSNGPNHAERWYGYVHSSGVVSDNRASGLPGSVLRYTLMGTSLPMNEERTRAWTNTTDSGVVRAIAKEHRLRTVIQRTSEKVPYIAQSGESDWRVLKARADRNGFRLFVDGSTVLFVDPTVLLSGTRIRDIQTYRQDGISGSPDTLVKWSASSGTMVPRTGGVAGQHVANGLDSRTKRVVTAKAINSTGTTSPVLTTIDTSQRISDVSQATRATQTNALAARGWNTAVATVPGSPGKQPGDIVEIQGQNIPAAQRGLWLVNNVSHRLINDLTTPTPFLTDLTLERDKAYAPTFNSSFRTISTRDSVPAIMRNGALWESETLEDVRVG